MFQDKRSKSLIAIAHCIINQNAKSDGTASYAGTITEVIELLNSHGIGIIQMPCPELHCLGLDRGDTKGGSRPVIEENSRIRQKMSQRDTREKINKLVQFVVFQIEEYMKHGFEIKGIIGINRSPSCGVETTSKDNQEIAGQGVFIEALQEELEQKGIEINLVGIKVFEPEEALKTISKVVGLNKNS